MNCLAFNVFIIVHQLVISTSSLSSQRSLVSSYASVDPLIGSKLYDVAVRSSIECQSLCLSSQSCTMVLFNIQDQLCSLFGYGSASYNVAGPVHFVESKQADGFPCPLQGRCLNISFIPSPQYCCTCQQGYAGIVCHPLLLSFQATRSTTLSSVPSVVSFDSVPVNHWSFNQLNSTFTAPVTGYYWLHMSGAIKSAQYANVQLQGVNRPVNIIRNFSTITGDDTTSASAVVYLTNGSVVYMTSQYSLASDSLLETTFGGFLLDSVMSPVVTFSFGLSTVMNCSGYCSAGIPFDITYIDTHNGWRASEQAFVVPVKGVYVVSLVAGGQAYTHLAVYLTVNGASVMSHANTADTMRVGSDTYSGLGITSVKAGDKIGEMLSYGTVTSMTTMSGFLYSPYLTPAIAFSVGVGISNQPSAVVDYVPFDTVIIDIGNGWNSQSYSFVTPYSGVYYVHMMLMSTPYTPCQMDLMLNSNPVTTNAAMATNRNCYATSGRGFILRLYVGDELHVRLTAGSYYSNNNYFVYLTGFLVHT